MKTLMGTQVATAPEPGASLLVVDDSPANLTLLGGMLRRHGYRVRPVPSGELALQAARHEVPDLILLDIGLPGMDGYEVCAALKADPALCAVPVIFVSAMDDSLDKVKAFAVGGVDYVTKPFFLEEIEARVRTHLALRRRERELQESYRHLQELERLRDSLTHLIVHDLRAPLMGISGFLELAREHRAAVNCPDLKELLDGGYAASTRMVDMVSSILDVSRLEQGRMPLRLQAVNLNTVVRRAVSLLGARLKDGRSVRLKDGRSVRLEPAADAVAEVCCDAGLIERVVCNLLDNAVKHTPAGAAVVISVTAAEAMAGVQVRDAGRGIPAELQQRIFERFYQVETPWQGRGHSTGLGLTFCALAVEAHAGQIGLTSAPGQGSTFWFRLPRGGPPAVDHTP